MKTLLVLAPILLAVGFAASPLVARGSASARQDPGQGPERRERPEGRRGERHEDPLHEHMEDIEHGLKRMRRILQDPTKRAECLEALVGMEHAALEAKQGTPPMTEKLPEAERAAFVTNYRKMATELIGKMLALEVALLDDEQPAIDAAFKELRGMEDKGHERFTEDG